MPPPLRPDHALFLDFDGTLVDIAPSPDSIVIDAMLADALAGLHELLGGAVAIVSGRPIGDLDRWLAPVVLPCAGVHGAERRDAQGRLYEPPVPSLRPVTERLEALVALHPSLRLERKSASVALHYRQAPELEGLCHDAVQALLASQPALQLLQGKQVLEVLPRGVDKGHAIGAFLAEPPFAGRLPVFVGDDVTDEAGFEQVLHHGGVAVKVGPGASRAALRMGAPAEVRRWLYAALPQFRSISSHSPS